MWKIASSISLSCNHSFRVTFGVIVYFDFLYVLWPSFENSVIFDWEYLWKTLSTVRSLYFAVLICKFSTFFTMTPLTIIEIFQVSWIVSIRNEPLVPVLGRCWLWHNFDASSHNKQLLLGEHRLKTFRVLPIWGMIMNYCDCGYELIFWGEIVLSQVSNPLSILLIWWLFLGSI